MSVEIQDEHLMHEAPGVDVVSPDHATELHGQLRRLAVLHELPKEPDWVEEMEYGASNKFHDRSSRRNLPGHFAVEAATHNGVPERIDYTADSAEKSKTLHAIHDIVLNEAHVTNAEQGTDWASVSDKLLERSRTAEDKDKDMYLVGAVACTQFAPDNSVREEFVRKVYESGIQSEIAEACAASSIVLLIEGPVAPDQDPAKDYASTTIHPIQNYALAFEMKPAQVEVYLANLHKGESSADEIEGLPSPKSIQKEVLRQAGQGEHSEETVADAEHASLGGEKVAGVLLDVNKIERFGLQQHFIKEQMEVVLAGPDLGHTALNDELAKRRQELNVVSESDVSPTRGRRRALKNPTDQVVAQLVLDVQESMKALSAPLIAKFSLENANLQDMSSLTYDQAAALRYRAVIAEMGKQRVLAQYLDFEEFIESRKREVVDGLGGSDAEIWTTAEEGAAAPTATGEVINNIVNGALRSPDCMGSDSDEMVSPEELRDFVHENRRLLLRFATRNIVDFDRINLQSPDAIIERDEQGRLALKNELPLPPTGSADMYAAIALGCPALREQHPDRAMLNMVQRAAYGSSNYIDHVMAAIINEAYARGIFDLSKYPPQPAEQAQELEEATA